MTSIFIYHRHWKSKDSVLKFSPDSKLFQTSTSVPCIVSSIVFDQHTTLLPFRYTFPALLFYHSLSLLLYRVNLQCSCFHELTIWPHADDYVFFLFPFFFLSTFLSCSRHWNFGCCIFLHPIVFWRPALI